MAIVRNIAGFDANGSIGGTVTLPGSNNTDGLFSTIAKVTTTAANVGGQVNPVVAAVKLGISLLPPGEFKNWMTKNPYEFWKSVIQLITGRKYTKNEYRLGERLIDQVLHINGPDSAKQTTEVPDDAVPKAINLFTILFGVRILEQGYLDALQKGASFYYALPKTSDIPREAVERAVFLKQNFYPDSTYNTSIWDMDYFSKYPLAAPIPDPYNVGQLYSGPLPGGGTAKNGIIELDISKLSPAELGLTAQGSGTGSSGSGTALLVLAALGVGGYLYYKNKNR